MTREDVAGDDRTTGEREQPGAASEVAGEHAHPHPAGHRRLDAQRGARLEPDPTPRDVGEDPARLGRVAGGVVHHQVIVLAERPTAVAAGQVLAGRVGEEADPGDAADEQLPLGGADDAYRHVRLALDEVHHRALRRQQQLDAGVLLSKGRQPRRDDHRPEPVRGAEAHRALRPVVEPVELALEAVDLRLHHLRALQGEEPAGGQRGSARRATPAAWLEEPGEPGRAGSRCWFTPAPGRGGERARRWTARRMRRSSQVSMHLCIAGSALLHEPRSLPLASSQVIGGVA
jgi:hypothetical protein